MKCVYCHKEINGTPYISHIKIGIFDLMGTVCSEDCVKRWTKQVEVDKKI